MDYDLSEEEVEIIGVFDYEMSLCGRKGFYSFHESIDNGYSIYKENNYWVEEFIENGKITKTKKYTNIYNLCLDILEELKVDDFYFRKRDLSIPRGTRVIISKSTDCPIDEIIQGIVISSSLSQYENSQIERVYQVLGSDGKLYTGLYGLRIYGDLCFRTMEDYIKDSEKELVDNQETIQNLVERNWEIYCMIQDVKGDKDRFLGERSITK